MKRGSINLPGQCGLPYPAAADRSLWASLVNNRNAERLSREQIYRDRAQTSG